MRTGSYTRFALWLVIPLLFVVSFIVSAAAAQVSQQQPIKTKLVGQRHFNSWSYLTTDQDGMIVVDVALNRKDNAGLRQYMQDNAILAAELFKKQAVVEGRVVFKQPLRENQLPVVVQQGHDRVSAYELRIKGAKGEKFTVFGAPDTDDFLPAQMLASFQHDIEHKTGVAEVKGFTNVTMTMSTAEYQTLANSPHVLFVDIVPVMAVEDVRQAFSTAVQGKPILAQYAPTYWYYEELTNP